MKDLVLISVGSTCFRLTGVVKFEVINVEIRSVID